MEHYDVLTNGRGEIQELKEETRKAEDKQGQLIHAATDALLQNKYLLSSLVAVLVQGAGA